MMKFREIVSPQKSNGGSEVNYSHGKCVRCLRLMGINKKGSLIVWVIFISN